MPDPTPLSALLDEIEARAKRVLGSPFAPVEGDLHGAVDSVPRLVAALRAAMTSRDYLGEEGIAAILRGEKP